MKEFKPESIVGEASAIVLEAGKIIIENSRKPKKVEYKRVNDLVTETDLAVEKFLKRELQALLPESSFLAEETAKDAGLGEMTWVIDPVDGTTNFAHGIPFVATSVGLWHHNQMVMGIINLPLLGELFSGVRGAGAHMNGNPIHVSTKASVNRSVLATGFPYDINRYKDRILNQIGTFLPICQGIRRPGAAALDLAFVACGRFDAFFEYALNPWDVAAGVLLIEEAGGKVTCMDGDEYRLGDETILVTNGVIHSEMQERLAEAGI